MDEYKQLQESLNAASNLRQRQPTAPPPRLSAALSRMQSNPDLDPLHKEEQGHHPDHAEPRVTGGTAWLVPLKGPRVNANASQAEERVQHTLPDKEGEAERRRELEEEEMAQAGQPQRLEEDLDQPPPPDDEEPEPARAEENALDRERRHSQQVSCPSAVWTGTGICHNTPKFSCLMFLFQKLSTDGL